MDGHDSKQSAGYFKEKATIGLSTFTGDEVVKAIMKATSHLLKAPKEKYMQKLVAASYGQYGSGFKDRMPVNEYIVRELQKRSHTHNWIVVMKTMVAFHRLLCDASDSMVETICYYKSVFNHSGIKNLADSGDGAQQAYFIELYMTYLGERCAMQSALGKGRRIEIPEFEGYLTSLNADTLQPVFETLLRQLEAISAVEFQEAVVNNFCTMEAYQLIVRDGKRLFPHLAKRVIFVLDGFEDFSLPQKRRWFDLYRRYDSAFVSLKRFFDAILRSSRVFVEEVPVLKPLPEMLVERLASDIRASEVPREEPCSLESLGIRSEEDKRVPPKEEVLASPSSPLPASPATAVPETKVAPRPQAAPAFSMDDLFVSNPEGQAPAPVATALAPQIVPPPPAASFQQSPVQERWDTGAPAEWSTGAPQSWSTGAPSQFPPSAHASPPPAAQMQSPPGYHISPSSRSSSSAQLQAPHPSKKPDDPFKGLYDSSHIDFN